jgi:hypothetical protein
MGRGLQWLGLIFLTFNLLAVVGAQNSTEVVSSTITCEVISER